MQDDGNGFYSERFSHKETDITLVCDRRGGIERAKQAVVRSRETLEAYIKSHPAFGSSFQPLEPDPEAGQLVNAMIQAGIACGVGPMATVAGAIADAAAEAMMDHGCRFAVANNGGDIAIRGEIDRCATAKERSEDGSSGYHIAIYAGSSSLTHRLAFRVRTADTPLGICTSAGPVGHSVSLGDADAVVVVSGCSILADAAATALCNLVQSRDQDRTLQAALDTAQAIDGIQGCLIVIDDLVGSTGSIPEIVYIG